MPKSKRDSLRPATPEDFAWADAEIGRRIVRAARRGRMTAAPRTGPVQRIEVQDEDDESFLVYPDVTREGAFGRGCLLCLAAGALLWAAIYWTARWLLQR